MTVGPFVLQAIIFMVQTLPVYGASERQVQFRSPNGRIEKCVALATFPDAKYKKKDQEKEAEFCSIDLYSNEVALCPKFWSTSPATILVSNENTGLSPVEYEAKYCSERDVHKKLAKFKSTMNAKGTSGTYSPASLLYYHFSRYFDTEVTVPVAVYRTIDKDAHFDRVTSKAQGKGKQIIAAWKHFAEAEKNPKAYAPTSDLFTDDEEQIYGVLLRDQGERYGAEFNGTRAREWGEGQNYDFQETPAFLALRSDSTLEKAMAEGIQKALTDPKVREAVGPTPISPLQMAYWMHELTEIMLLDYIFNQQDRVGNIDYEWKYYYADGGKIKSDKIKTKKNKWDKEIPRAEMHLIQPPAEIAKFQPILLQRTSIGDNDAGGRLKYRNFTKDTKMLEKLRHFNADTYRRLLALSNNLRDENGSVMSWLRSSLTLTTDEIRQIQTNTANAAKILRDSCRANRLKFDLDAKAFHLGRQVDEKLSCDHP